MAKKNPSSKKEKNTLKSSNVSAGRNVHIGDIYNYQDLKEGNPEKRSGKKRNAWLIRIISFSLLSISLIGISVKEFVLFKIDSDPVQKSGEGTIDSTGTSNTVTIKDAQQFNRPKTAEHKILIHVEDEPNRLNSIAMDMLKEHFSSLGITMVDQLDEQGITGRLECDARVTSQKVSLGIREGAKVWFRLNASVIPMGESKVTYNHSFSSKSYTVYDKREIETVYLQWLDSLKHNLPKLKFS